MINVLVLGANGLIGANIVYSLKLFSENNWNIFAACRANAKQNFGKHHIKTLLVNNYFSELNDLINISSADLVINCVGIVSQVFATTNSSEVVKWNAYFPNFLHQEFQRHGIRFINISTDCVFAKDSGDNDESSKNFAYDLYGTSKLLGEINSNYGHTIRLSTVGFEYGKVKHGLFEWFLESSKDQINGFSEAIYSGTTGSEVFRIIDYMIQNWEDTRLLHFEGYEISKYELLNLFKDKVGSKVSVLQKELPVVRRNLKSRFVGPQELKLPLWPEQLSNLMQLRKYYG
jgi:dTDP-4-dehydrorhamnose reductase